MSKSNIIIGIALAFTAGVGTLWYSKWDDAAPVKSSPPASLSAPMNPAHEIASLEEELKKKPNHSPILVRLAELHQQAGHQAEAIRYLKQVVDAQPSNAQERLELGKALYESGDTNGAIEQTKEIVDKDPTNVDALYNLGAIYGNQGQLAEAKDYFTKAVAADSSSDSGQKAKAALTQLSGAPPMAPASGSKLPAPSSNSLPPGHPPIGQGPKPAAAVLDDLLHSANGPRK